MSEWEPLNDIWSSYNEYVDQAREYGALNTPEEAEAIIWPRKLYLADTEKEDIAKFIAERTNEITNLISQNAKYGVRGTSSPIIASYIFRVMLAGMVWEKDRIGN